MMRDSWLVYFLSWMKRRRISKTSGEKGAILALVAVMLPTLIGLGALVVDVGSWYFSKRKLQTVADVAAVAGAIAMKSGHKDAATINSYATHDAALNNFVVTSGKTLTINNPPLSGSYAGNNKAIEAIVQSTSPSYFLKLFLANAPQISARSVTLVGSSASACMVSLGSSTNISLTGISVVTAPLCSIYSNGTGSSSIKGNGGAVIVADSVSAVGGISGASIVALNGTTTNAPAISDPLSTLAMPVVGACNYTNYTVSGFGSIVTLNPGVYCGGIKVTSAAIVTMNPGTYIMNGGTFTIGGQATLTGVGVSIVLTSTTGSGYPSVSINGGAIVALTAPTSGSLAGILFYSDRNTPSNTTSSIGGLAQIFNGILYFPSTQLALSGNKVSLGLASCLQVIAGGINVSGTTTLGGVCLTSPKIDVGGYIQLVE